MPDMPDLIEILESFNRKERFFLVSQALGHKDTQGQPAFKPNAGFLKELCCKVKAPEPKEGERVFVAMDYHLNWVHASLVETHPEQYGVGPFPNIDEVVGGNQQDIDLLVAFREGTSHHLILIEAKAYGRWDKDQLQLKAPQLGKIFGADGKKYGDVRPHFLLMSPEKQGALLPQWMRQDVPWPRWILQGKEFPAHLPLSLPPKGSRLNVGRCDANGKSAKDGGHYKICEL